jgi:N-methylhydantoinase A
MLRIGIDTGGTFTDFVIVEDGRVTTWKEPSTPDDPARAILQGLKQAAGDRSSLGGGEVIHGSTVATNALLEGATARIAFVTNRGFEDLLEIGRQSRPELYNLMVERPASLVPRELRFGISGRLLHDGSEARPLDPAEIEDLRARLEGLGVEAAAICLLHSYAGAAHEEAVAAILARAGMAVSVSSRLVPEHREYERASTAAVNAAVTPVVSRYLGRLEDGLKDAGLKSLRVMGSNGGALSCAAAGREAVRTVLSGPAAGVRAALHVGRAIGSSHLISFDMGGTSTDVCLIPGEVRTTGEAVVAGHPVKIPTLDIHTVGAGGGSIAWRDAGGALRVGPASAGAVPGPACYGKGGPPTVTDANVALGRIAPEWFLGGRMALDVQAARAAIASLADALGMDVLNAAEGIVQVAEATMARAIRVISLHRGHEPGDFVLLAFGGCGGLHAAALADALDIGEVIVPHQPGVFSAYGMTVADLIKDRSASVLADDRMMDPRDLLDTFASLEAACRDDLMADGAEAGRISFDRTLDVRYRGQSYEINIPFTEAWAEAFHASHQVRFGYQRKGEVVELVAARARGIDRVDPPEPILIDPSGRSLSASLCARIAITWRGKTMQSGVHDRGKLPPRIPGAGKAPAVAGPALVVESGATTLVPPGWTAWLDAAGHIHMRRAG